MKSSPTIRLLYIDGVFLGPVLIDTSDKPHIATYMYA